MNGNEYYLSNENEENNNYEKNNINNIENEETNNNYENEENNDHENNNFNNNENEENNDHKNIISNNFENREINNNYEKEEINDKLNKAFIYFNKKNYSPNPINEPKEGISKDYILYIDESLFLNLQCGICYNLLWNPMMCNDCGNSFCEYCIKKNLTIGVNKCCPICRSKQFNPGKAKVLNKFFGRVKIRCNNKQCKEKPEYFNYIKHLEECPFRLYHCTNEGCKYEDTLDNIKHHSSECPNRIIKCKFCSKEIKEYTFKTHEKTECTQNVECGKCHTSMTRGFYWKNHYSENDENIECLKARNDWKGNEIKKLNEKIEEIKIAHQKEIEKYKNKISALDDEKKK